MAEANRQLQLLADAGRVLSGTLEIDQQIERLAELVVPTLGDWCWIMVTDEHGRLQGIASSHRDPDRQGELDAFVRSMVGLMTEERPRGPWSATGRPHGACRRSTRRTSSERYPIPTAARGARLGSLRRRPPSSRWWRAGRPWERWASSAVPDVRR